MAMTIAEAQAVNDVLGWIAGDERSNDKAQEAAMFLAERANATLHAGFTGERVALVWAEFAER